MPRVIKQKETQQGFTLIEIMVVLVILGALAVISVPVYSNYVRRAKVSEAISNVEAFANAIRIYRMERGVWPPTKDSLGTGNNRVVNVTENYFTIRWPSSPAPTGNFVLTMNPTNNFDSSSTTMAFTYTITPDYVCTWDDSPSSSTGLLHTYASYLFPAQ